MYNARTVGGYCIALGLLTLLSVACSAESRLQVGGPTPYVRCLAGPEPEARTLRVGAVSVAVEGRIVSVQGLPARPRLAAFSGPGFGRAPAAASVAALGKAADLILMLGGLGESPDDARATLVALDKLERPVLFLAGGRDRWAILEEALPSAARIIDVTRARELRIGRHTLLPVAGADSGRYSVDDHGCGFAASDLAELAEDLGSGGARGTSRWLVAWHAPAAAPGHAGVTRTETGVDTGSWNLSRFAVQVGVKGGIYAWPANQSGRSALRQEPSIELVVPRLWGPRQERSDGSLAPLGFALLELGDGTLTAVR
jgi:hypothetical protein